VVLEEYKMTKNNDTFLTKKITNNDMWQALQDIKAEQASQREENKKHFQDIADRQNFTNGKVKLSKWIASTALVLTLMVLGFLIEHISKIK
jgi:hypothetical protein